MGENRPGNICLYMIFAVFNLLVLLSALGILGSSIFLFVTLKEANLVDVTFLLSALFLTLFSMLAFQCRRSVHLLWIYLFILFVIFTALLICCLVLTFNKTLVTHWADKLYNEAKAAGEDVGPLE